MKKFLAFILFALGSAATAFGQTAITGTFKTPAGQTPSQAALKTITTVNGVPVYGTADFDPYDQFGARATRIVCAGVTFLPQTVHGWIKGDGTLVNYNASASSIPLIPTKGCQPTNLVYRAIYSLNGSTDLRISAVSWTEFKEIPQMALVDWSSLGQATFTKAAFSYVQQNGGTILDYVDFAQIPTPGNPLVGFCRSYFDIATQKLKGRTSTGADCNPSGSGGGSQHQVNSTNVFLNDPINYRDNTVIIFTNPSQGNIEAGIANNAVTDAMLFGSINPAKITGTAETLLHRNQANGYAPLDGASKLPLANLPTHVHAESDVTNLISDLAGKANTSHTHDAADIITGTLNAARLPTPTSSLLGGVKALTCTGTDKLSAIGTDGIPVCSVDQTGSAGSGITTLNGLNPVTQTFAKVDDTNVTFGISSVTATHTFTIGWIGTLAKGRQNAQTVYLDQANTWSAGAQDFGAAASLGIPKSAGAAPTANGLIAYDTTANAFKGGVSGVTKTFAFLDSSITGNAATATALAANGANCVGNLWARGVDASGVCEGAQIDFSNLSGSIALGQTVLTTRGDLLTVGAGPVLARLGIGAANRALISNGTDASWGQIDISTSFVTGVLGIANGGTGASTSQAAINNLSQLNTTGDLEYFNGTNTTRLGRGTNAQCLTSTTTTIQWASCATGAVGGTGTTNKVPVWTAANTLGDSPFQIATNELQPVTDAVSDLGDATHRFKDIYFSGSLIGSATGPISLEGAPAVCTVAGASNGKLCLDSTGNRFRYSYSGGPYSDFLLASDKAVANGVASLDGSTKVPNAQISEVLSASDLTTYASVSGTGTAAIAATISSPATNHYLGWNGTNWVNRQIAYSDLSGAPTVVNSFNSRNGTVVPTSGDYSFSLISGLVGPSQLPFPTASLLGGVMAIDCTGIGHIKSINTDGTETCSADSGGAGAGAPSYPFSYQTRVDQNGLSLTSTITVANTITATSLIGQTFSGRQAVLAGSMLPYTNGAKTMKVHATGVLGTAASAPTLTVTVSLGGVTLSAITVPVTGSLTAVGWELDYYFTVNTLTTANVGGCVKFIGASSAVLAGCASNASVSGLNFAADQAIDVKATWGTASVSNTITVNQLTAYTVQQI